MWLDGALLRLRCGVCVSGLVAVERSMLCVRYGIYVVWSVTGRRAPLVVIYAAGQLSRMRNGSVSVQVL